VSIAIIRRLGARLPLLFALVVAGWSTAVQDRWVDTSPHRVLHVNTAPGVVLEVLDWGGRGEPVVLLAGLDNTAHVFDSFAPELTNRFHVYGITRRGNTPESRPTAGDYRIATLVEDIHAILDTLGLKRVDLIGHSIAGDEVTKFAATYPDRVDRLVYLDAAHDRVGLDQPSPISSPPRPDPTPVEVASVAGMRHYLLRVIGVELPEAEVRRMLDFAPDGHFLGRGSPERAAAWKAIIRGVEHPQYGAVRAPALAFYALQPKATQAFPWYASMDTVERREATANTDYWYRWALQQRATFLREMRNSHAVDVVGGNHYVFISNEPEVLHDISDFLAGSPRH
jgi:pimeloyl-ACP methyl ester carboxylesterase